MRWRLLFFLLSLFFADPARAQALASVQTAAGCLAASIEQMPSEPAAGVLHRIVFVNRCAEPRSFYWCAEHAGTAISPPLACPRAKGFPAEPRHAIFRRKEFQWHLPRGSRIRFHDCGGQEIPTAEFGCARP